MAGRGEGTDIPAFVLRKVSDVKYDYVCSFGADRGLPFSENGAFCSDGWEALHPCRKHPSTAGPHFGPEMGFAARLSDLQPHMPIAIIKHGRGGSCLATDWNPRGDGAAGYYDKMIQQVRSALGRLEEREIRYTIKGFVWMQGEGDAIHRTDAESYRDGLSNLISAIRVEVGKRELPAVIGRIGIGSANPAMLYSSVVRQAQDAMARDDTHTSLVDTDDLPLRDSVHYDSSGLLELGRRFADTIKRLEAIADSGTRRASQPEE